jgi:hypothetical protein
MAFTNGTIILASDINAIWETGLASLRSRTQVAQVSGITSNIPYKQYCEIFRFDGITSTTAEHRRGAVFVPRTDVIVRGVRVYCQSATTSIVATVSIPAQIYKDNNIVGGNIKRSLTATATSQLPATYSDSGTVVTLDTGADPALFTFLAGDNIEILVSTNNVATANVTVSLLLETLMVNK